MIDFAKEVYFNVGDNVKIESLNGKKGKIKSIRIISEGRLVENYQGTPERVVLSISIGDGIVNKRGMEITPILAEAHYY
ncbi:MAG: hypothetical protein C4527_14680 [Candidatus Omnitrophota bacterium]|jgi:hypothetical protein|nr:MAG: hypothetical protein C4527_14680 [Candidatus Omnitrophota bacterium]